MTEEYEAVKVKAHITGSDVPLASHKRYRAHYETFVLTSTDGAQQILPEDADREIAYVQALDNDIVIGPTKGVVGAAQNQVANVPQPNGTYIPKGNLAPYPVCDNGPVFAGITSTSNNSRVSVAAYYRVP